MFVKRKSISSTVIDKLEFYCMMSFVYSKDSLKVGARVSLKYFVNDCR